MISIRPLLALILAALLFVLGTPPAEAHVPYLERLDYSENRPEVVEDVEQSKAYYGWLQSATDVDYYTFEVTDAVEIFAQALVPVCPGYEAFLPWFALVGPGLPEPNEALPPGYTLPEGYGAIVTPNLAPGEPRETFYEPFGGKFYYDAPIYNEVVATPGTWYLLYWDPAGMAGDYVGVIGREERFRGADILRALINTPIIRDNGELHVPCED